MKKPILLLLGAFLALAAVSVANAQLPPLPTIVSGTVTIDGSPAPAGKTVTAYIAGEACGTSTTDANAGYTIQVGGKPGNPAACDQSGAAISFKVDGFSATGAATREQGALKTVNLTVSTATPPPAPVPVTEGLNISLYNAPPLPVDQALGPCLSSVSSVFFWDSQNQTWAWWIKAAPNGVNTLMNLDTGKIYFVNASSACS